MRPLSNRRHRTHTVALTVFLAVMVFRLQVHATGARPQRASAGDCYVGLRVGAGDSCTYPGTTGGFWVDQSETGHFRFGSFHFLSGKGISALNTTIGGVLVNFAASRQSNGAWLIEAVPDATNDRATLIALYEATDGANWTRNDNWLAGAPLAEWYGVTTDDSGRVTGLSLNDNRLSGGIPDLSALSNLTYLSLSNNWLSGPIPDLSALSKLTYLSLSNNWLSGPIPDVSALSSLTHLYLWNNRLNGPIPDLSTLSDLTYLVLRNNWLNGPIPDLSTLSKLTHLHLGANKLSGPIPDLSALSKLTFLNLSNNGLSGPIPDLSALSNLTWLVLSNNKLSGPIPDLSALSRLTHLHLGANKLSGPIPDLSALSRLMELGLRNNELCLPEGADLSGTNQVVTTHLNSLNLPLCASAADSSNDRAALVAPYETTHGARDFDTLAPMSVPTTTTRRASGPTVGRCG